MKILNKAALEDFDQYLEYSKKGDYIRKAKGLYTSDTLDIDDIIDDVCYEMALKDFEFSGKAAKTRAALTDDELDELDEILDEVYLDDAIYIEDLLDEEKLNDLFANGRDSLAETLGYEDWKDLMEDR